MKHKPQPAPTPSSAAHAESLGDYAQARVLSRKEAVSQSSKPSTRQSALSRYARLGSDPMAWRVGLGALCAYMAVWFYALTANR